MTARILAASVAALMTAAPACALTTFAHTKYSTGFETGLDGWTDFSGGTVERIATPLAHQGGWLALARGGETSLNGPFSMMGGAQSVWTGDWAVQTAIYLNTAWAPGTGFEYSVAANGSDGAHQRDFVFNVARDADTGTVLVNASNNSTGDGVGAPANLDTQTGRGP